MTAKQKALATRLYELEKKKGYLTPQAVVNDARNPKSPLHERFEWDDQKAANAHRLDVARELIREVRYIETITRAELECPNYASVSITKDIRGYVPMDRAKKNKEWAHEILNDELTRVRAALERSRGVCDILKLRDELEIVLQQLLMLQEKAA
jgi:hypothetical protein